MHIHFGHTKSTILAVATITILMALGAVRPAFAGFPYTNSYLLGCYAHRNSSVDTQPGAKNSSEIGTSCFDGLGNVVYSTLGDETGSCSNVNGAWRCSPGTAITNGTYNITNTPGSGMGTVSLYQGTSLCEIHEISIFNVQGPLALGFEDTVIARYGNTGCANPALAPRVVGGTAIYQGP